MSNVQSAESIGTINGVELRATDVYTQIGGTLHGSIEWGDCQTHAAGFRGVCDMHSDIDELAATGVLFELVWSVSNHWLWKYTNDHISSEQTLDGVARLPYAPTYDIPVADRKEIVERLWAYLNTSDSAQNKLIRNRSEQLNETVVVDEVYRLDVERYAQEYSVGDVLYTDADRRQFQANVDESGVDIDVDARIDDVFEEQESAPGREHMVVVPDSRSKPTVRPVSSVFLLDSPYREEVAKTIEVAPSRDDLGVSLTTDYGSGRVSVQVEYCPAD